LRCLVSAGEGRCWSTAGWRVPLSSGQALAGAAQNPIKNRPRNVRLGAAAACTCSPSAACCVAVAAAVPGIVTLNVPSELTDRFHHQGFAGGESRYTRCHCDRRARRWQQRGQDRSCQSKSAAMYCYRQDGSSLTTSFGIPLKCDGVATCVRSRTCSRRRWPRANLKCGHHREFDAVFSPAVCHCGRAGAMTATLRYRLPSSNGAGRLRDDGRSRLPNGIRIGGVFPCIEGRTLVWYDTLGTMLVSQVSRDVGATAAIWEKIPRFSARR